MLHKYLITSREFYTDTPVVFRRILQEKFVKHMPDFALYRDKQNIHYKTQAEVFVEVCQQFESIKSFIHSDVDLACKLGAYGVHLTSQEFEKIEFAKKEGLRVIISTHSKEEVLLAQEKGADFVTYSPIFSTPNKGEPKGIEDLESLLEEVEIKVIALGGILREEEINAVAKTAAYGFASIRYFN